MRRKGLKLSILRSGVVKMGVMYRLPYDVDTTIDDVVEFVIQSTCDNMGVSKEYVGNIMRASIDKYAS